MSVSLRGNDCYSLEKQFLTCLVCSSFQVIVVATDAGVPRLSTEKSITVVVEDENDNAPEISSLNSVLLLPGTPKGTTLMTIKATDNDASSNGIVTFRFAGEGNPTSRGPLTLDQVKL